MSALKVLEKSFSVFVGLFIYPVATLVCFPGVLIMTAFISLFHALNQIFFGHDEEYSKKNGEAVAANLFARFVSFLSFPVAAILNFVYAHFITIISSPVVGVTQGIKG